jgi:hypothetical protein
LEKENTAPQPKLAWPHAWLPARPGLALTSIAHGQVLAHGSLGPTSMQHASAHQSGHHALGVRLSVPIRGSNGVKMRRMVVLEHLRLSSYSAGNMMTVEAHPHDLPTRRAKGRAGNMANEVPAADEVVGGSCERGRAWASFDAALADEKRTMPRMAELLTGEVQIQWRISFFGEDKGPLDRFLAQIDLAGGGRCAAATNN